MTAPAPGPSDGRGKLVRITCAGRAVQREALDALAPDLAGIEAVLGADGFEAALPFLETVRRHPDGHRDRTPAEDST